MFQASSTLYGDAPVLSWDGKQLAFFATNDNYIFDMATKKITQVSDGVGYGRFDWK